MLVTSAHRVRLSCQNQRIRRWRLHYHPDGTVFVFGSKLDSFKASLHGLKKAGGGGGLGPQPPYEGF